MQGHNPDLFDDLVGYAAFRIMPRRLAFMQTGERRQRGMSA